MKKVFKVLGLFFLGLVTACTLLLAFVYLRSMVNSSNNMALLGPEAPVLISGKQSFRDLNKNGKLDPYEDHRKPVEDRVTDLLSQMTIEEKAGAMFIPMAAMNEDGSLSEHTTITNPLSLAFESNSALVVKKHINHVNTLQSPSPRAMILWHNQIQKLAERTRLGIPVTLATDPRHGVANTVGASIVTPFFSAWCTPLGLAAIGDTALVREFGDIARREYLAMGFRLTLSPMADLATEPRWGRINGTFGEDANLAAKLTKAYILGFQGDSIGPGSVECMVKHFAGGGPQLGGRDAHFPPGKQNYPGNNFKYHLIPFEEGAFPANAAQVMPYYGIPVGQTGEDVGFGYNKSIVTGMLREQYGFQGIICTDWGLVSDVSFAGITIKPASAHGVENLSIPQRVQKILDAGCDMFGGEAIPEVVVELVKSGQIPEARLDESVRRILKEKFKLGLFDNPYIELRGENYVNRPNYRKKGEESQRRSLVLLKNESILPLKNGVKVFYSGFSEEAIALQSDAVGSAEEADVVVIKIKTPEGSVEYDYLLERVFTPGTLAFSAEEESGLLALMKQKPTVTVINLQRPAVIPGVNQHTRSLIADFSSRDDIILELIHGVFKPEGKLPLDLPSSMKAVEVQMEDLPFDTENPLYRFGHGLTYQEN
ncbi:MAG: glycoside hydrolase family 3 C-terminal domain-containing protein [Bacteroidetes bacterium]|nr:glycoside hydrolase family 3 C-terminal domain-containing protein [Bacteroidota bacterium]